MEKDEKYQRQDIQFELKLLNKLNVDLENDPNNNTLLQRKGGILAAIGKYNESYQIFINLLKSKLTLVERERIYLILNLLISILCFENKYEQSQKKLNEIKPDWAENLLLDEINKIEIEETNFEFHRDLVSNSLSNDDVFILGPKKIVNNFNGVDSGIHRTFIGYMKYPFAQATREGFSYYKEQNYFMKFSYKYSHGYTYHNEPSFIARFPTKNWDCRYSYYRPNPNCDVYYSTDAISQPLNNMLQYSLDRIAKTYNDYFRPKYQNIIDPNLTAVKQNLKVRNYNIVEDLSTNLWIATDFIIEENKITKVSVISALQLSVKYVSNGKKFNKYIIKNITDYLKENILAKASIASPIPNFVPKDNKELYVAVETIMTAAISLLSKLRKPALILPGKLQVVIKAQRIYLAPGEEYSGIWHRDGKNEDIVAAVIYYYRTSPGLEGGDLEFVDKKPIIDHLWLYGDCSPEDFTKKDLENYIKESRCRVPVKKGTLVVFSNYQHVHRVLNMVCPYSCGGDNKSPDGYASRDFIVFFIVDQKSELISSSKVDSCESIEAYKLREKLFEEQIAPSGTFGPHNDLMCSTGNGCLTQIGWNRTTTYSENDNDLYECNGFNLKREGFELVKNFNIDPPFNRGLSWALESEDEDEKYISNLKIKLK